MKSVSLIMSVYNEENTIKEVLDKLKNIDYLTELVIVDNGSTDSSYSIIDNAKNEDDRIKLNKELTKHSIIAKFTYYSITATLMVLLFIAAS